MEQLIELLKQIQDLSGVAIDALQGAGDKKPGDADHDPAKDAGAPPHEGSAPPPGDGAPHGGGGPGGPPQYQK